MPRILAPLIAATVTLCGASTARGGGGYFGDSSRDLPFEVAGTRTANEKVTLLTLVGATVFASAIGTYYALDSRTLSDSISASGEHTLSAWDQGKESTRVDALRSASIAKMTLGMGGGLALATLVAFIITHPDTVTRHQDWQASRRVPQVIPVPGGIVMSRGWSF